MVNDGFNFSGSSMLNNGGIFFYLIHVYWLIMLVNNGKQWLMMNVWDISLLVNNGKKWWLMMAMLSHRH